MPGLLASRRQAPSLLALAAALSLTFWAGCGDDDKKNPMGPGGGATSSSFTGWLGNGSESGMLTLTVNVGNLAGRLRGPAAVSRLRAPGAASRTVNASGILTLSGGATDTLSGTFEDETGYIDLVGGAYTLAGVYDSGPPSIILGTYMGPNGDGDFLCQVGGSTSASIYCGTFMNEAQTSNGTFIVAVRGNALEGAAIENGGTSPTGFTGTASGTGTTRTLAISSTITNGYKLTASGSVDTGTQMMGGTYRIDDYSVPSSPAPFDSGGWTGELCQ